MIYCVVNRIAYSSGFNIFAVIAGIFLIRGGLRTASAIRWYSTFLLATFFSLLIIIPWLQPLDLTLAYIHLFPGEFAIFVGATAMVLGLLLWVSNELGREPVQMAITNAGIKRGRMRIPCLIGFGLVALIAVVSVYLFNGDSAKHAEEIARQELGPKYSFHVRSLSFSGDDEGRNISGIVVAWNKNEIREIPVSWHEP
jgi:hypothetical protein